MPLMASTVVFISCLPFLAEVAGRGDDLPAVPKFLSMASSIVQQVTSSLPPAQRAISTASASRLRHSRSPLVRTSSHFPNAPHRPPAPSAYGRAPPNTHPEN